MLPQPQQTPESYLSDSVFNDSVPNAIRDELKQAYNPETIPQPEHSAVIDAKQANDNAQRVYVNGIATSETATIRTAQELSPQESLQVVTLTAKEIMRLREGDYGLGA